MIFSNRGRLQTIYSIHRDEGKGQTNCENMFILAKNEWLPGVYFFFRYSFHTLRFVIRYVVLFSSLFSFISVSLSHRSLPHNQICRLRGKDNQEQLWIQKNTAYWWVSIAQVEKLLKCPIMFFYFTFSSFYARSTSLWYSFLFAFLFRSSETSLYLMSFCLFAVNGEKCTRKSRLNPRKCKKKNRWK